MASSHSLSPDSSRWVGSSGQWIAEASGAYGPSATTWVSAGHCGGATLGCGQTTARPLPVSVAADGPAREPVAWLLFVHSGPGLPPSMCLNSRPSALAPACVPSLAGGSACMSLSQGRFAPVEMPGRLCPPLVTLLRGGPVCWGQIASLGMRGCPSRQRAS